MMSIDAVRIVGRRARMVTSQLLRSVAVAGLCAGCATGMQNAPAATAAEIPALEARLGADSADVTVLVPLGAAYRDAGRLEAAQTLLTRAVERQPSDPGAVLYLGFTYEDRGQYPQARQLYQQYLEIGRSPILKAALRKRLPLLARRELEGAVRDALAREESLAATPPQPDRVAVYPFLYSGTDPELEPLSRAFADMLTTDLSQTERLRVVERAQVQLLLDEIELGASGYVDPATAPRSGRLLGAGRIVQGRLAGDARLLELQALLVEVGAERQGDPNTLSDEDALARLFDLEERLALAIYRSYGIDLTPDERARVLDRPTENIQALLAYGLGLEADDQGNYALAAEHFARAVTLDPAFEEARERAERAADLAAATELSTIELAAMGASELNAYRELAAVLLDWDRLQQLIPSQRDPAVEVLGKEGLGTPAIIEIILRRP